jgi:ribosome modulation factor
VVSNDEVVDWSRQYQVQKRACDEANGVLRNIVKRAKSNGVNVKAMIAVHVLSKLDLDVVIHDLRDQIRYMALRRMPVHQTDLFEGWTDTLTSKTQAQDQEWEAYDAGYAAGRQGVPVDDCPYPAGSELALHWRGSWQRGQASLASELGPDVTAPAARRTRPLRVVVSDAEAQPQVPDAVTATDPAPVREAPVRKRRASGKRSNGKTKTASRPRRRATGSVSATAH